MSEPASLRQTAGNMPSASGVPGPGLSSPGLRRGVACALAIEVVALWAVLATDGWLIAASLGLGLTLLALVAWDLAHYRLPDALTYPLLAAGLATAALIDPARLPHHLIGAAVGFLSFAALRALYFRLRGREGIGLGDAKLLAALGAWLTWDGLASVVLIACAAAFAVTTGRALAGRPVTWSHRLPFGAYLALGGWLVWLYGPLQVF